jgi:4-alpha-glucanotransferase
MIRAAMASVAELCVIPLQDVLGLGSDSRMNIPSYPEGNWTWRYQPDVLTSALAGKLATISEVADRNSLDGNQKGGRERSEDFSA